ncbi:MAG: YqgE/AlgH family protein [Planctomycetota bacterium]
MKSVEAGSFLIAGPGLQDPNFCRAVVLLCDHNEDGSLGLIVNRPLRTRLAEVFPELSGESQLGYLHSGGPVETQRVMALRRSGQGHETDHNVVEQLKLVVAVDELVTELTLDSGSFHDVRFFVGYAGWGRGQLANELKEGAWITRPATSALVFDVPPAQIWSRALRELGGYYALLAEMPLDPDLN